MKHCRRRKCRCCQELFHPDPRNQYHQHYCTKPACRKASKAANQLRWLSKLQNQDYFCGPANVERVQAWRAAHPGYSRHSGRHSRKTLQDDCMAQPIDNKDKSSDLTSCALQDLLCCPLRWSLSCAYSSRRYPMQRTATCSRQGLPKGMPRLDMNATSRKKPFSIRSSNSTTRTSCRKWKHRTVRYLVMCGMNSKLFSSAVVWSTVFYVFNVKTVSMSTW